MANFYEPQAIWGRELRHHRRVACLTQGQLSEKIHFSESLISGIENGRLPASFEFAESCDEVLNTGGVLCRLLDWRKGQIFPAWLESWPETEKAAIALRSYQPDLMREQLQRLLDVASPRLSIELLPHGMHAGLMGGFVIATMENDVEVAYVETLVRGITTNVREDVSQIRERFETIRTHALPMSMSIDLIKKAMEERWA